MRIIIYTMFDFKATTSQQCTTLLFSAQNICTLHNRVLAQCNYARSPKVRAENSVIGPWARLHNVQVMQKTNSNGDTWICCSLVTRQESGSELVSPQVGDRSPGSSQRRVAIFAIINPFADYRLVIGLYLSCQNWHIFSHFLHHQEIYIFRKKYWRRTFNFTLVVHFFYSTFTFSLNSISSPKSNYGMKSCLPIKTRG